MQVKLKRLNSAVHFEGTNDDGNTILIDGSPDIGGEGKGVRPLQLLLMSLGGCSGIDVVTLLKKMRQPLEDIQVEINGERAMDEIPAVFTKIHLRFILKGDLNPERVERAISKSVDKYCSVARMIEKKAELSWSYEIRHHAI
jgi:putative redox protein